MPMRPFSREQAWLMPPTLDELVPADHPVRFAAAFVDSLDAEAWEALEIDLQGDPRGAGAYHPRALLSVWIYGFMTGVRSCRKLEAACRDQVPYMWLVGMQQPDHNTLWRFYKAHRDRMRTLLRRTVRTAVSAGLVDLAVQAVDGTRIAANASMQHTHDAVWLLQRLLTRTERRSRNWRPRTPLVTTRCNRACPRSLPTPGPCVGGWARRWPASRLRRGRATRT